MNHQKSIKNLWLYLHSFLEFERLYLDVGKPKPREYIKEDNSCETISDARSRKKS